MSSLILGIESSCDETAAALVDHAHCVRSSVVASQHDLHQEFGGVVPEIASRAHLERSLPVLRSTLKGAGAQWSDIEAVAVGHRPGLIGSLLVGTSLAKAIAWTLGVPLIGVDHVHAHLFAGLLNRTEPEWPALGFVVSGGHTSLMALDGPLSPVLLGRTIDDAVGEAFDKVGAILGLPHPGGPAIDRLAEEGNPTALDLPIANLGRGSLDFSFSGLKTAVLYATLGQPNNRGRAKTKTVPPLDEGRRADVAASFQRAAIAALMRNLRRAIDQSPSTVKTLLVGGGVASNSALRAALGEETESRGIELRLPPVEYCVDNAAMIALAGLFKHQAGEHDDWTLVPAATMSPA